MSPLRALIAGSVRNPILAHLLAISIFVSGYFAATRMTRELFPDVTLDHIAIEVRYPGASPADVEQAICTPIEEAVRGIRGVRDITSSAIENFGTVWLSLQRSVRDPQRVLKEVQDRVDQVQNLPAESETPVVRDMVLRAEVIQVAVYGEAPESTIREFAREVRDDLLSLKEISQVLTIGAREPEIVVEVSEAAARAHNLSIPQITSIIRKSSLDLPAGVIRTQKEELALRIMGQKYAAADYESLVVAAHEGANIRLGDIATIREDFADAVTRARFNGQSAVLLSVQKTQEQDAPTISQLVRDYVAQRTPGLPSRLHVAAWGDTSVDITSRTQTLINDGLFGLIALFFTLSAFMGLRYAFWVCADIPMCFAGAFAVMWFFDQSFNMITLFALIMVGGIIVDDSLVIAESVHLRTKMGDSPEEAAIEGTYRMAGPVIGATCMTITMFVPLLFVSGVMGKFIYPVPIVIIAVLCVSLMEAFCILPSHLCRREKKGKAQHEHKPHRVQRWIESTAAMLLDRLYRPAYRWAMDNRVITLGLATLILLLAGGMVVSGRTPFVLLPKEDSTMLRARVRFPEGTPASVSEETAERISRAALALNEDQNLVPASPGKLVQSTASIIGEFADFALLRGNNLCEVNIELMSPEIRDLSDNRIMEAWRRHIGEIDDAIEMTIARKVPGPTDRPIEIRLLGDDFAALERVSDQLQSRLREFDGVTGAHQDLTAGKRELRVSLRPVARTLGLVLEDLATQLRQGFYGGEAVTLQRGRDQVKVRVRFPEDERQTVADLENMRITTPRGDEVPFLEVADAQWGQSYGRIMHQDGKRRVRVVADLDEQHANAEQIVRHLESGLLQELVEREPGVTYKFGGDREHIAESLGSLTRGSMIAVLVMYGLLAALLGSWVQPLVILITVPFGWIGSIVGHMIMGYDITLMSLFGMVAVSGIVVNHSLVIVEAMREALQRGRTLRDSILEAGEIRFQAVLLTSITDVASLGPLLIASAGQAQSVMPMAISLCFGLIFSTVVTLCIVPAAYLGVNDLRRFGRWVIHGGSYPSPEMVEEVYRAAGPAA